MIWLLAGVLAASPAKTPAPDAGTRAARSADGGTALSAAALKNPILVDANHLKFELKNRRGIYTGNVRVRRGTTHVTCDRLVAHYTQTQEISRVECDGNVQLTDKDRWAAGEHADFDITAGLVVLTGNPQARQGPNELHGERIVFDVVNDVVDVQGGVRTTFESSGRDLPVPKKGGR